MCEVQIGLKDTRPEKELAPHDMHLLGKDRDNIKALGWGHMLAGMLLAEYLVPHKEVAFVLEVDVTVGTDVTLWVP